MARTFSQARHTSSFEMTNGLPHGLSSSTPFLPETLVDHVNEARTSRSLRSAPTALSRDITATVNRSDCAPDGNRYSAPRASGTWGSPSRCPACGAAVSGHALRRSAQAPQTRLAPPSRRAPPGQRSGQPPGSSRARLYSPVLMPSSGVSTLQQRTPGTPGAFSATPSWSPPDTSTGAFSSLAHHDSLQLTQQEAV